MAGWPSADAPRSHRRVPKALALAHDRLHGWSACLLSPATPLSMRPRTPRLVRGSLGCYVCDILTLGVRRGGQRERGTSGRWQPSPARLCSARVLVRMRGCPPDLLALAPPP